VLDVFDGLFEIRDYLVLDSSFIAFCTRDSLLYGMAPGRQRRRVYVWVWKIYLGLLKSTSASTVYRVDFVMVRICTAAGFDLHIFRFVSAELQIFISKSCMFAVITFVIEIG
jgi:hypothetical protein